MKRGVIRIGDPLSSGGQVVSACSHFKVDGKEVSGVGDACHCDRHGDVKIVEGIETFTFFGKKLALHGCKVSCGCTVISTTELMVVDTGGGSAVQEGQHEPPSATETETKHALTLAEKEAQTDAGSKNALSVTDEGSKANLARREAIAAEAVKSADAHDTSLAYDRTRDAGTCSEFVSRTIVRAGSDDPRVKKSDGRLAVPGAAEWAGSPIPGWRFLKPGEKPQPGDVGAVKMDADRYHGATGHVVIVGRVENGRVDAVAAHSKEIAWERGVKIGPPVVWRRYIGE